MKKLSVKTVSKFFAPLAAVLALTFLPAAGANASYDYTFTITAAQIVGAVQATGDQLSTPSAVYGISDIIIRPDGISSYTISNPVTSLSTWNQASRVPGYAWPFDPAVYPANGYAEFYYPAGSGNSPAYVLTDQQDMSRFPALYEHDMLMPPAKAPDNATFTFTVTSSMAWDGKVRFELEGYRYPSDYNVNTGTWEVNFGPVGSSLFDLQHNRNGGYSYVPIPAAAWLLGTGLLGLIGLRRKMAA